MDQLERWLGGLGEDEGRQTLAALTKVGHTYPHLDKAVLLLTSCYSASWPSRRVCGMARTNGWAQKTMVTKIRILSLMHKVPVTDQV